jgi:predicted nucleic acid-binding protein
MRRLLIDSNVFIQAKNLHYRFDFCSQFWKWVEHAHSHGMAYSIEKVKKELDSGDDEDQVKKWITTLPASFFLADDTDITVMRKYAEVMQWNSQNTHFKPTAKTEFAKANVADAFLLATAMAYGYEIVTHELSKPEQKKKIQLPDAAIAMGVKTHFVYDILDNHCDKDFLFCPVKPIK